MVIFASMAIKSCAGGTARNEKDLIPLIDAWIDSRVKRRAIINPQRVIDYGTLDSVYYKFHETEEGKHLLSYFTIDGGIYRTKMMHYYARIAYTDVTEKEAKIYLDSANYWAKKTDSVAELYKIKKSEYTIPLYKGMGMTLKTIDIDADTATTKPREFDLVFNDELNMIIEVNGNEYDFSLKNH